MKLKSLKPDPQNARQHPSRNISMIEQSLAEVGAARSIVVDEDDVILAGSGVYEAAVAAGIENVQVVEADGNTIIAVKRSNLTPEQKRRLAYFDNRTAELADWDIEQIVADLKDGVDLDGLWYEDELAEEIERHQQSQLKNVNGRRESLDSSGHLVKLALYAPQVTMVERAISATGKRNRGEALVAICEAYLGDTGQFDIDIQNILETKPAQGD